MTRNSATESMNDRRIAKSPAGQRHRDDPMSIIATFGLEREIERG